MGRRPMMRKTFCSQHDQRMSHLIVLAVFITKFHFQSSNSSIDIVELIKFQDIFYTTALDLRVCTREKRTDGHMHRYYCRIGQDQGSPVHLHSC